MSISRAGSLENRVNNAIGQLFARYTEIISLSKTRSLDQAITATETYQIQCNVISIIRSTEDLLDITRLLKEEWVLALVRSKCAREIADSEIKSYKELENMTKTIADILDKITKDDFILP